VQLEFESTIGVSLVSAAIIVGGEDINERKHDNPEKIGGSFAERRNET
jgi:hypothetical protein